MFVPVQAKKPSLDVLGVIRVEFSYRLENVVPQENAGMDSFYLKIQIDGGMNETRNQRHPKVVRFKAFVELVQQEKVGFRIENAFPLQYLQIINM